MSEKGSLTANPVYPVNQAGAEAKDVPPVATGLDSTPSNWFELAADLCASGKISETRFRRAIEAVRKGVERD